VWLHYHERWMLAGPQRRVDQRMGRRDGIRDRPTDVQWPFHAALDLDPS
jgi:hypothetical protein